MSPFVTPLLLCQGLQRPRQGVKGRSPVTPFLLCLRCVSCTAKLWMTRGMNSGDHIRAHCCFLQDCATLTGGEAHPTGFLFQDKSPPQRDMAPNSPSGCARFLGPCHCLISSSLLFSSPLPARAQTQELFLGLSKDSWQGSQCLTLSP